MKVPSIILTLLTSVLWTGLQERLQAAALPPSAELLPENTWAFISIPHTEHAKEELSKGMLQLWMAPPMQPFREHVETQINERFLTLLKKEAGIDLAQWNRLAKGQTTLALIPGKDSLQIKPLLLIDSGGEVGPMNELTEKLTSVLTEKGQPFARETIEGISMIHIPLPLEGTLLDPSNEEGAQGLCVAQAESTLLVTTSRVTLQQIMRRAGGQSAGRTLSENPRFQMMEKDHFQGSLIHGWIQFPPILQAIKKEVARNFPPPDTSNNPLAALIPTPQAILGSLHLEALEGFGFAISSNDDAQLFDLVIQSPESTRNRGLLGLIEIESSDATPPDFVSEEVASFQRIRIDGKKLWLSLEGLVAEISPQMAEVVKMSMSFLGKDRDPAFDFRKSFIDHLGDDFIVVQWPPKSIEMQDLISPPQLFLIGSSHPEILSNAFIAASGLLPTQEGAFRERAFLGRTIYSITVPVSSQDDENQAPMGLHFAPAGRHVAISTHTEVLEDYLRGKASGEAALSKNVAFDRALKTLGSGASGYLHYQNPIASTRLFYEQARKDPQKLLSQWIDKTASGAFSDTFLEVFDFKKLPPFDVVESHLTFALTGNISDQKALKLRSVAPNPPALK